MNRFGEMEASRSENVEIPGLGGGVDVNNDQPTFDEPTFDGPTFDNEQVKGYVRLCVFRERFSSEVLLIPSFSFQDDGGAFSPEEDEPRNIGSPDPSPEEGTSLNASPAASPPQQQQQHQSQVDVGALSPMSLLRHKRDKAKAALEAEEKKEKERQEKEKQEKERQEKERQLLKEKEAQKRVRILLFFVVGTIFFCFFLLCPVHP